MQGAVKPPVQHFGLHRIDFEGRYLPRGERTAQATRKFKGAKLSIEIAGLPACHPLQQLTLVLKRLRLRHEIPLSHGAVVLSDPRINNGCHPDGRFNRHDEVNRSLGLTNLAQS